MDCKTDEVEYITKAFFIFKLKVRRSNQRIRQM